MARKDGFTPKAPDYVLKMITASGPQKSNRVGAGWYNEKGYINIQLDVGIRLDWTDDVHITLFPVEREEE